MANRLTVADPFGNSLPGYTNARCKTLAFLSLAFLQFECSVSEASTYLIHEPALSEKLSQNSVVDIEQDHSGFLWFATLNSISKYDGYDHEEHFEWVDSSGQFHPIAFPKLARTINGEILAISNNAPLLQYDPIASRFVQQTRIDVGAGDSPASNISEIFISSRGDIWIGYSSGRIARRSKNSEQFAIQPFESENRIVDLSESKAGEIAVLTEAGQLAFLNLLSPEAVRYDLRTECQIPDALFDETQFTGEGSLLIGTKGLGLYRFDIDSGKCNAFPESSSTNEILHKLNIHEIKYDSVSDRYLVASDSGMLLVSNSGEYKFFNTNNSGLSDNEVTSFFIDNTGDTWIGTFSGVCTMTEPAFDLFSTSNFPQVGSVVAISGSDSLGTWVATYDGLYRENSESNTLVSFNEAFPGVNVSTARVMTLLVEGSSITMGYRNQGLLTYETDTGDITQYSVSTAQNLSSDSISALLRLNNGHLLIGTYGGGLNILSREGHLSQHVIDSDKSAVDMQRIVMLYQDSKGRIWVGTEGGLRVFDPKLQSMDFPTTLLPNIKEHTVVWTMTEDSSGNLWFGTLHDGLFKARESSTSSDELQLEARGIQGNVPRTVFSVQSALDGSIWIASSYGLSQVSSDGTLRHFRTHHGLQGDEFEFGASHKDSKGRLYFGGSNGYNRFDPSTLKPNSTPPMLVLTDLSIAGKPPKMTAPIQDVSLLELKHSDYYVTFEFSALDFLDPENNQYRYMLEGFDYDWIDVGNRNTATYTNLPAGQYNFRVQAANSSGIWNYDGISVGLRALPPPWRSWWAYCSYALLISFIAWHIKRTYDNYLIRTRALELAEEMQIAADRAMDDVQEQLDLQSRLVESIHRYNLQKLQFLVDSIDRDSQLLPPDLTTTIASDYRQQIVALECLEQSLFYKGEVLLADLEKFICFLEERFRLHKGPQAMSHITVINSVGCDLASARLALPVALILLELMDNAIEHGFEDKTLPGYIRISLEWIEPDDEGGQSLQMSVADSGVGLPDNVSIETPESSGLSAVAELVTYLSAKWTVARRGGTVHNILIPVPDELRVF